MVLIIGFIFMLIMLFFAVKVKSFNLQPRTCMTLRCEVYRNLEVDTGIEYELVNNLWKKK